MTKKLPGAKIRPLQLNPVFVRGVLRTAKHPKDSSVAKYVHGIAKSTARKSKRRKR